MMMSNEKAEMREKIADSLDMCYREGFWFARSALEQATRFRSTFEARDDDVFLTSSPKTGTGWLKSISLSILRKQDDDHDILTTGSPYSLVPTLVTCLEGTKPPPFDPYDAASSARLLHTHVPYSLLPTSLKNSAAKIVYITRNPKDTVVSMWHFINSIISPFQDPLTLEYMVDSFCSGTSHYGPFWDHVLEYWLESKIRPEKILFLKYEELKTDTKGQVSRIAEFLGKPIGDEDEVDEIVRRCSLGRLKNLEVNKNGPYGAAVPNSVFHRKGEVGDFKNYLTHEMEARIDEISRIKLEPFGIFL
ncbi:hypothetical protein ACS0TY_025685 [Phlomoides rotata]